MIKRIIAIVLILALALSMTAYAAEPRAGTNVRPTLSFSGTTANCNARIIDAGSEINATLTLYRGWSIIASWSGSGTSVVNISGTAGVKDGLEYRLVVSGTVDGVPFTSVEVVGTC